MAELTPEVYSLADFHDLAIELLFKVVNNLAVRELKHLVDEVWQTQHSNLPIRKTLSPSKTNFRR
ncbi:hypothetical protein [Archaeoglobus veneficus]|uniref:hypothetical protein n=1 Tax=Archaeoglobus veneficus TaxID=58290 RepID=UPI000AA9CDC6|nr:hypothetical protein [Archaeoglobus veneficus]